MNQTTLLGLTFFTIILALFVRPLRKTLGLLLVILGFLACLTFIGLPIGIPIILVGGLLLFI